MSQVLIHFDEATLKAIDRIAPVARRKRADFIRQAVKDAIFRHETERMREAYRRDVAVLPPSEVRDIITRGGFGSPVLFFQAGMIHGWYAKRCIEPY